MGHGQGAGGVEEVDWSFVRAGVPRPLQAFLVAFPGLGQSLPGPARILKGQGYGERAGLPGTGFRGILEFLEGLDGDVLVQVFPGLGQGCGHCGVVALLGEELGFLNDLLGEDRGVDAPCDGPAQGLRHSGGIDVCLCHSYHLLAFRSAVAEAACGVCRDFRGPGVVRVGGVPLCAPTASGSGCEAICGLARAAPQPG